MLDVEQGGGAAKETPQPLTYGSYLRVPDLLRLQSPLGEPGEHDEMLFIIVQQVQELWFKQVLHELHAVVGLIEQGEFIEAAALLNRVNAIIRLLGDEVTVLETMPPQNFHRFRHVLTSSSGLESEQYRELELASGLNDPTFLKLISRFMDTGELLSRWPVNLHNAFRGALAGVNPDPVEALVCVYNDSRTYSRLYMLAEALSAYEVLFCEWRFHHIKLVERMIGDHSPGTAGSTGAGYLGKTLNYRFFPELWEARNRMASRSTR